MRLTNFLKFVNNVQQSTQTPHQHQPSTASKLSNASTNNNAPNAGKFSPMMQMYASKVNTKNLEEYQRVQKVKTYNRLIGAVLTTFVLGVYGYTMFAISQEKFLDDFDVPEPPDPAYQESVTKNVRRAH
jgi:hypothetical protein